MVIPHVRELISWSGAECRSNGSLHSSVSPPHLMSLSHQNVPISGTTRQNASRDSSEGVWSHSHHTEPSSARPA